MVNILSKENCTGCAACANCCPVNCITMVRDGEGFAYPQVDATKCTGCGLCEQVCPVEHTPLSEKQEKPGACAAINRDDSQRFSSASGGVFPLLARQVIEQGGVVFGAAFDDTYTLRHTAAERMEEVSALCSSKYVQSEMGDSYAQVKNALKNERKVLFVGTPCQVAGLKNYLGDMDASNLFTADFICHGVPSPGVWETYFDEALGDAPAVRCVNFRYKKRGWAEIYLYAEHSNGDSFLEPAGKNAYMQGFLKDMILRPSCYACKFKTVNRCSDLTLADFWGLRHVLPELYDNKGCSLLLTHSPAGEKMLENLRPTAKLVSVDLDTAISYNTAIQKSAVVHPMRAAFFEAYERGEVIVPLLKTFCRDPFVKRCKNFVKRILRAVVRIFH